MLANKYDCHLYRQVFVVTKRSASGATIQTKKVGFCTEKTGDRIADLDNRIVLSSLPTSLTDPKGGDQMDLGTLLTGEKILENAEQFGCKEA